MKDVNLCQPHRPCHVRLCFVADASFGFTFCPNAAAQPFHNSLS